jgi:hypothetical protein
MRIGCWEAFRRFNPKTEIEPQISQMATDDQEVMKDLSKPV